MRYDYEQREERQSIIAQGEKIKKESRYDCYYNIMLIDINFGLAMQRKNKSRVTQ